MEEEEETMEDSTNAHLVEFGCQVQWGHPHVIHNIDVCSSVQQQLYDLAVPIGRSNVQLQRTQQ